MAKKTQQVLSTIPTVRYRRGNVPAGFDPVYVASGDGGRLARYRCRSCHQTLTDGIRRCCWIGRKKACGAHSIHDYSLPRGEDPLLRDIPRQELIRQRINERILCIASEFVISTNISCRQVASPPMHRLIVDMLQLGASLVREIPNTVLDVSLLIDQITQRGIAHEVVQRGDERFEKAIRKLRTIRFVNLVVDAGTVHSLKSIPCLLTNPHYAGFSVLLELHENSNFTAEEYQELFANLFRTIELNEFILCSVVIDNLPSQSSGLDRAISERKLPVLHVKCFAHMANLVLLNSMSDANFDMVFGALTRLQNDLRKTEVVNALGKRCPRFVRTRWFYMVDTLAFICDNAEAITGMIGGPPAEIYELYAILNPYLLFVRAIEERECSLGSVVLLVRRLLVNLNSAWSLIRTSVSKTIFRDMYIRLLSRLMCNNREECITSYLLTPYGRYELRTRQKGYTTCISEDEPIPRHPLHSGMSYDEFAAGICELILNTPPMIDEENCGRPAFGGPSGTIGDDSISRSYDEWLDFFANMNLEDMMKYDPYETDSLYEIAIESIEAISARLMLDKEAMKTMFRMWLFGDMKVVSFLNESPESVNEMWRIAHRLKEWRNFAEVSLRFISCATSEADAERILSVERNIAGLCGTRFGIRSMEARLRGHLNSDEVLMEKEEDSTDSDDSDSVDPVD
jgi:hypothetical protein